MFFVYILQSLKSGRYYVGHAEVMEIRLAKHNQGATRSTKHDAPWKIVKTEEYQSRAEAAHREREIKNYKGGIKFKKLLGLWEE